MLVPMHTSWQRHRRHAVANFVFRAAATAGFAVGVLVAVYHRVGPPPTCDVQHGACLTRVVRYEAHVSRQLNQAGIEFHAQSQTKLLQFLFDLV